MKNRQLYTSDSNKWNTPRHIVEAVLKVLGAIDLDPCSNARGAAANVPAKLHYTIEDDGLAHEWIGRIYMNPPYGSLTKQWASKLATEYRAGRATEAIALVAARPDTTWARTLFDLAGPVCFYRGRLHFSNAESSAPFPSAIFYFGLRPSRFIEVFAPIGEIRVRPRVKAMPSDARS